MKTLSRLIVIGFCLLIAAGCSRVVDGGDQLSGYWRGFIQITKGTGELGGFIGTPTAFYCKIEQTGNAFIGKYSHTFDADAFKSKMPEWNYALDGVIMGDKVKLRLSNISSKSLTVSPDSNAELKYGDGRMSGTWIQFYKNEDGSVRTTYEGVIELVRY
jgi:hypothetical protein